MPGEAEYRALLHESADELYEHAPAAYFSSLVDGTLVKVNETLLRWTLYERDDLLGRKRFHDLLPPGARIYYETHYAPLLQMQGNVREIATELLRADGSRLPVLLNSTLVRDDEGRPQIIRTTAFDASERRHYEKELLRARADAESRARASLALAHVTEGVVLVGYDGRVELLNPAAEGIFAVAAAAVTGKPAAEAVDGWDALCEGLSIGRPGEPAVTAVVPSMRQGHEQWLAIAATDAGHGIVYTIRDVTSDRRLEELRSDLVTIVSHELRTPLTGVHGAAQTLLARYQDLGEPQRRALLEMLVEQTRRLSAIVDQILLTSRIDTDNVVAANETFDASAVFETAVHSARSGEPQRVIVDVQPGILVRGDLDRLRQVVTNLVDNALKYSDGAVRLSVAPREFMARFTVTDEGPGIPPAEHAHVFEKFYRLDPQLQSGVGGTGLGLYIARELVERMHGRIGLLPRASGTTFFVDVPLAGEA
jgi:PAS domain S-box-containing protein